MSTIEITSKIEALKELEALIECVCQLETA